MKRTALILLFTVLAGVGLAQVSRQDPEAFKMWSEGRDLYDHRRFPEAEKKLREGLSKYPRSEWADRISYYLILTLEQLRRVPEARTQVEDFLRRYPDSKWSEDVISKSLSLGGRDTLAEQEAKIARERAAAQARGSTALPMDASVQAALLREVILRDPDRGFANVRDLLRKNADDPVVLANFGTFYLSHSPQAVPLLMDLYMNAAASPKTRESAFYWAVRTNPDKTQVAEILMEKLTKPENEPIVRDALLGMSVAEHRAVLGRIAQSSAPDKFSAIEKIYRRGSVILRSDLVTTVAKLQDPKAIGFVLDVAENDKDLTVRRAAVDALISRKDVDATMLENILKGFPRPSRN